MSLCKCLCQSINAMRDGNCMDVIIHEAVCPDFHIMVRDELCQELEISCLVLIAEKDRLAAIAALGYVMGDVLDHYSGYSRHDSMNSRNHAKNVLR